MTAVSTERATDGYLLGKDEGEAHWLLGMTAFTLNNWSAAMRHYEEALRLSDATAETTLAASVT